MRQIDLPKSTEKDFFTVLTAVTVVRKFTQPLHKKKKNMQSQYFGKVKFDTFDNQYEVLMAAFCDSCNVFVVERLRDFVCGEVA